jgi:hypothetical protein
LARGPSGIDIGRLTRSKHRRYIEENDFRPCFFVTPDALLPSSFGSENGVPPDVSPYRAVRKSARVSPRDAGLPPAVVVNARSYLPPGVQDTE